MIPINLNPQRAELLAQTFGCQLGSMPFSDLGLPMGTTKPSIEALCLIMDRVERSLSSCSSMLTVSGSLEMVNSTIIPITTYAMCTLKFHKGSIENIDRARKQCIWRGNDRSRKGGILLHGPY